MRYKKGMKKETIGKIALDLMKKEQVSLDPIELERAMHAAYEDHVYECIAAAKKKFNRDFYVVVVTKKEQLMQNVLRNYFYSRISCPTPDYDQTVYWYHKEEDALEFLWVIPSKDACLYFQNNALEVVESERELRDYVLAFADGSLFMLAKKLNGELDASTTAKA